MIPPSRSAGPGGTPRNPQRRRRQSSNSSARSRASLRFRVQTEAWSVSMLSLAFGTANSKEGLISGFPMAQIGPLARRRGETAPTDTEFLPLPSGSAVTG